ncbi:MAG: thermonuclease family protein [Clostridia bacterium]|nr:thermonuclease family protein [Clostridia bacterium]
MIGINTPESVAEDESRNCEEGVIASDYTKDLLTGKEVFLEYDEEEKDQYDRTLAYVYLEDGEMVECLLLEQGYATTMYREPNTKHADLFSDLMKKAKKNKEGF